MEKHEWSLDELTRKAEAYCARTEHCVSEMANKLQQWGADTTQTQRIIDKLKDNKFIDEQRYCRAYVRDKVYHQGWGRVKIQAALYTKRLAEQDIDAGLESIDQNEYIAILQRVMQTKKRAIKPSDPMAREKLIRFLLQRGFTYDEIKAVI